MFGIVGVADFDGDGILDIAGASSVLFSRTDRVTFPVPPGTDTVAVIARLSRMGQPALLRISGTTLQSIRFSRDRTISIRSTPVAGQSRILAVGDLNGDGIDDAVLREGIYFGNGDGTYTAGPPLPVVIPAGHSATVAVGDFDGDHHLDLAIRPDSPQQVGNSIFFPVLTVYSGDGAGHFQPSRQVADDSSLPIHVADVDGDGKDDLIINLGGGIDIVPSRVGAATQRVVTGGNGGDVKDLTLGDFNGDGRIDIAAITRAESTSAFAELRVWLSDQNGVMQPAWRTGMQPAAGGFFFAADIDGDGNDDLVMGAPSSGEAAVIHSNGDGSFAGLRTISVLYPRAGAKGDFDGDGDDDLLTTNYPQASILWNDGNGLFHTTPLDFILSGPVIAADIDGDGKAEIIASIGLTVSVLKVTPDGSLTKLFDIRVDPKTYLTGIAAGRFTGGALEVALAEVSLVAPQGQVEVFDLRVPAAPRFTAKLPFSLAFDIVASDLNGDRRDDLIVVGEGLSVFIHDFGPRVGGYVAVLLSTGSSFQPPGLVYQTAGALQAPVGGDFNGDGLGDAAFIATTGSITVLYGDRSERFHLQAIDTDQVFLSKLTAADLDGDGAGDLLVGRGGTIALLFGSPAGISRQSTYLSRGSSSLVFALRPRPGGVPMLLAPDYPDALLFFPVCGRERAVHH